MVRLTQGERGTTQDDEADIEGERERRLRMVRQTLKDRERGGGGLRVVRYGSG